VVGNRQLRHEKPQDVPLATILVRYYQEHAVKVRSGKEAKIHLALWSEVYGDALVSDLTPHQQEDFHAWLFGRGYSGGYVGRILTTGRAALSRAVKRQELERAPFILGVDRTPDRERRRLSMEEVAALLNAAAVVPHLLTFCIVALNTLARPEAILDLTPFQVDTENRLLSLNPSGRKQTKKYRPVVPITDTLLPWVTGIGADRIVNWHGKPVKSVKTAFRAARRRAGLPDEVSPYSLRHTMATELRKRGVPDWEVQGMMGHTSPTARVTEIYAKYSPSYLGEAARAIDTYFGDLQRTVGSLPEGLSSTSVRSPCVLVAATTGA
jgi:integrase